MELRLALFQHVYGQLAVWGFHGGSLSLTTCCLVFFLLAYHTVRSPRWSSRLSLLFGTIVDNKIDLRSPRGCTRLEPSRHSLGTTITASFTMPFSSGEGTSSLGRGGSVLRLFSDMLPNARSLFRATTFRDRGRLKAVNKLSGGGASVQPAQIIAYHVASVASSSTVPSVSWGSGHQGNNVVSLPLLSPIAARAAPYRGPGRPGKSKGKGGHRQGRGGGPSGGCGGIPTPPPAVPSTKALQELENYNGLLQARQQALKSDPHASVLTARTPVAYRTTISAIVHFPFVTNASVQDIARALASFPLSLESGFSGPCWRVHPFLSACIWR